MPNGSLECTCLWCTCLASGDNTRAGHVSGECPSSPLTTNRRVCVVSVPLVPLPNPNCTPSTQLRPPALHPLLTPPGGGGVTKTQVSLVTSGSQCQLGLSVTGVSDCQRHDHTNTDPPPPQHMPHVGKGPYTTLHWDTLAHIRPVEGGCTNTM